MLSFIVNMRASREDFRMIIVSRFARFARCAGIFFYQYARFARGLPHDFRFSLREICPLRGLARYAGEVFYQYARFARGLPLDFRFSLREICPLRGLTHIS